VEVKTNLIIDNYSSTNKQTNESVDIYKPSILILL